MRKCGRMRAAHWSYCNTATLISTKTSQPIKFGVCTEDVREHIICDEERKHQVLMSTSKTVWSGPGTTVPNVPKIFTAPALRTSDCTLQAKCYHDVSHRVLRTEPVEGKREDCYTSWSTADQNKIKSHKLFLKTGIPWINPKIWSPYSGRLGWMPKNEFFIVIIRKSGSTKDWRLHIPKGCQKSNGYFRELFPMWSCSQDDHQTLKIVANVKYFHIQIVGTNVVRSEKIEEDEGKCS